MNVRKIIFTLFALLIPFSLYHLCRDVLQDLQVKNALTAVFTMNKHWCSWYCNALTYPFEIFIALGSGVVLKRKKVGVIGILVLAVFVLWLLMFLYNYFLFNSRLNCTGNIVVIQYAL